MEIVTTETLPPEASMAGNNTVYCHCQALNKRSNYGVCLFTLKAHEEARLSTDGECHSVIGSGNCEARRYRQKERDAGKALFYKKREIPIVNVNERPEQGSFSGADRNSQSFKRGWDRAGSKQAVTKEASKPKASATPTLNIIGTLTDAVNAAMKSEAATVKPVVSEPKPEVNKLSTNKPKSLLERARMALNK